MQSGNMWAQQACTTPAAGQEDCLVSDSSFWATNSSSTPCPCSKPDVCMRSVAASGLSKHAELMQQEHDIASFLEAYPGNKAAKLAELEGMQLASRPSNRAGMDPAALAALEQQVSARVVAQ